MEKYLQRLNESAAYIRDKIECKPEIGLILGSGLGMLADEIEEAVIMPYESIPNFPVSTVPGHEGKLVSGRLMGKTVLAMKGRFHYYEGYEMKDVTFPVRVMKLLGIESLIITNAAGGINRSFSSGALMIITDHIKFFSESPLRGPNMDEFGPRFPDMTYAYTPELGKLAVKTAKKLGIDIKEGVYAFMPGPSYETPAEIRALGILGADAVGMSTVPEALTAAHCGMKALGISCITNMAAGIIDRPLSHKEVMETAEMIKGSFINLVKNVILDWDKRALESTTQYLA